MRVGTVVKHQGSIGNLGLGVITRVAGCSGHAGFKYVAWECLTAGEPCQYVVGEFVHLLEKAEAVTYSDRQKVKRIKAYIAEHKRSR